VRGGFHFFAFSASRVVPMMDWTQQQSVFRVDADRNERGGPCFLTKSSCHRETIIFRGARVFRRFSSRGIRSGSCCSPSANHQGMRLRAPNGATFGHSIAFGSPWRTFPQLGGRVHASAGLRQVSGFAKIISERPSMSDAVKFSGGVPAVGSPHRAASPSHEAPAPIAPATDRRARKADEAVNGFLTSPE
jgi:hypothetical protein